MGIKFANSAFATLASSITNSDTSITLTTGQGARFPSLAGGDYFYATLIDTSNNLEIVKCTARSTDVLTVTRAQESTTARSYSAGDRIELRITAQSMVDAGAASLDGDRGDITVSSSGTVWTIDNGVITDAKIADMAATKLTGTIDKARMYAGAILQVVQTKKTDTFSTSSTSFVDITGMSASITPRATSSTILVMLTIHGSASVSGWYGSQLKLLRGSTDIAVGDTRDSRTRATLDMSNNDNSGVYVYNDSLMWIDSPSTTSSTTYKLQVRQSQGQTWFLNRPGGADQNNGNASTVPSTITLMEIAG